MDEERFFEMQHLLTREFRQLRETLDYQNRRLLGAVGRLTGCAILAISGLASGKEQWVVGGLGLILLFIGGRFLAE